MTTSSLEQSTENGSTRFPDIANRALSDLRSAITQMFAEVPGGVRKSYDVNKILGVDARLSWQIFKLTGPGETSALVPHIPAPATMQRLLTAASKHGISAERVSDVRRAFRAFEAVVKEHAGDRSSFDTMMRGPSDDELSQQADVAHRKAIFKGYRHYMAVEFDTYVNTLINYPTADPELVDIGNIRSKMGMQRLRPEAEIIVDSPKMWNAGDVNQQFRNFDPNAAGSNSSGILPEFCSKPLPELKCELDSSGQPVTSLTGETLGKQGQVDLVFGGFWRGVRLLSPDKDGSLGFGTHIHISSPTNHFYVDVLVPRAMFENLQPTLEVYGIAPANGNIDEIRRKHPKMAHREKIERLIGGLDGAQIREVPHYVQMVKSFCERMGWRVDEFEVFRIYLKYPIIGSLISLRFNKIG